MMRDFESRMAEMRRQRRRFSAMVGFAAFLVIGAGVTAGAWLLTHPGEIGAFAGRIVAGFERQR